MIDHNLRSQRYHFRRIIEAPAEVYEPVKLLAALQLHAESVFPAHHEYAGTEQIPPMVKCLNVRIGLYISPSIFCATRSPHRYTTSDVPICVAHGLLFCVRA